MDQCSFGGCADLCILGHHATCPVTDIAAGKIRLGLTRRLRLRNGTPGLSEYWYRENKKQRADEEVSHVAAKLAQKLRRLMVACWSGTRRLARSYYTTPTFTVSNSCVGRSSMRMSSLVRMIFSKGPSWGSERANSCAPDVYNRQSLLSKRFPCSAALDGYQFQKCNNHQPSNS